jgi:hypothetical protein
MLTHLTCLPLGSHNNSTLHSPSDILHAETGSDKMPPKVIVTPLLCDLVNPSRPYPALPGSNELSSVLGILSAKQTVLSAELEASLERQKSKDNKKKKDRDVEGSEAMALAANAQSGAKLEAIEKARAEGNLGRKGTPGTGNTFSGGHKVKRERTSGESASLDAMDQEVQEDR